MKRKEVFSSQRSLFRKEFIFLLILIFSGTIALSAQDEPKDSAPPPIRLLSKEEKAQLEAQTDVKKRTKLGLDLMDARLKKAEELNAQENYEQMYSELGGFHAVLDNTLDFLNQNDTGKGKVLNNFKRLEMSLRNFLTRIELIRRDLPLRYEFYVRTLAKQVREARAKAVEPMFSETVVPAKDQNN